MKHPRAPVGLILLALPGSLGSWSPGFPRSASGGLWTGSVGGPRVGDGLTELLAALPRGPVS